MKTLYLLSVAIVFFAVGYWMATTRTTSVNTQTLDAKLEPQQEYEANKNQLDHSSLTCSSNVKLESIMNENKNNQRLIKSLEQRLSRATAALRSKENELEQALNTNVHSNEEKSTTRISTEKIIKHISKERAESILPKPFSEFFVDATGRRAEQFDAFQNEEQNYDWAYVMEIQIKDFILIHPEAMKIELQSVICKTTSCEIMLFEKMEQTTQVILRDMRKQDWWEFQNTNSSSSTSEEYGQFFYVMLSK